MNRWRLILRVREQTGMACENCNTPAVGVGFNWWLASEISWWGGFCAGREGIDLWQVWALGRPSDQATHQQHTGLPAELTQQERVLLSQSRLCIFLCGRPLWKMHMNVTCEHMLVIYEHMWEHVKFMCFCENGFCGLKSGTLSFWERIERPKTT